MIRIGTKIVKSGLTLAQTYKAEAEVKVENIIRKISTSTYTYKTE